MNIEPVPIIERFKGTNYPSWICRLQDWLEDKNLWQYVTTDFNEISNAIQTILLHARAIFINSIDTKILTRIGYTINPYEAFIKINQIYKELNANSIQFFLQGLDSLQLKNDFSNLGNYFEAKERLFNELAMAGKQLTESEKFTSAIKGLPISLKSTG